MRTIISTILGATVVLGAPAARAQTVNPVAAPPPDDTDHAVVVGHLGLRYFGAAYMPALAFAEDGMTLQESGKGLTTVGLRYWFSKTVGADVGVGVAFARGSTTVGAPGTTEDEPAFFALGVQAAMPIMVAEAKHLAIHVDPGMYLRYGRSAIDVLQDGATTEDRFTSVQFGIGGNVVAELQFGFMGVPQLGLEAQLGVALAYDAKHLETTLRGTGSTSSVSTDSVNFGTTAGPAYGLDQVLKGSLSAVWYFGARTQR